MTWSIDISLSNIESYEFGDFKTQAIKNPTLLNAGLNRKANLIIKTKQPIKARSLFGNEKLIGCIALNLVDTSIAKALFEDFGLLPTDS